MSTRKKIAKIPNPKSKTKKLLEVEEVESVSDAPEDAIRESNDDKEMEEDGESNGEEIEESAGEEEEEIDSEGEMEVDDENEEKHDEEGVEKDTNDLEIYSAKDTKGKSEAKDLPSRSKKAMSTLQMITEAIAVLNERNGSSQSAILRHIRLHHLDMATNDRLNGMVKLAIKRAVNSGNLLQVKRSFKLPKPKPKNKPVAKSEKQSAKTIDKKIKPKSSAKAKEIKPTSNKTKVATKQDKAKTVDSEMSKKTKASQKAKKVVKETGEVKQVAGKKVESTTKEAKKGPAIKVR